MADRSVMTPEAVLADWLAQGGRPESDVELRLIRRLPSLLSEIQGDIVDPVERALAGLDAPPPLEGDLRRRLRIMVARSDSNLKSDSVVLSALEEEAHASGEAHLWITAARLHSAQSVAREAEARMALSDQALPYVFPGELDPLMVHLLSSGECILPALHVDWIRKLTVWLSPALTLDCRCGGMWFWPVLRSLDAGKLSRPLAKLSGQRLPAGGYGLAAAYSRRIGLDDTALLQAGGKRDRIIAALAVQGDASR
jgi:hypothetical protein